MKFCLKARQSREYLKKADEILVEWTDKDYIYDLAEQYPQAKIILATNLKDDITENDWKLIKQYKTICKTGFVLCLYYESQMQKAKELGYNFFYAVPVKEPYLLNSLISLGVCAVRISGMLCHCLNYIDTLPVEIRVIPNLSGTSFNYEPACGSWFRPEDLINLTMIDVCEFYSKNIKEEQALYRIYAEKHEWPGELHMIISDIQNKEIINRMIPPDFQKRRSNCKQFCQYGGHCHFCNSVINLANPVHLEYLMKFPKQSTEYYDPEMEENNL